MIRLLRCAFAALVVGFVTTAVVCADSSGDQPHLDVCWNYLVAKCPDAYEFYWRPNVAYSRSAPATFVNWVTVVAPATTYFFFDPAPTSQAGSLETPLFGWDYNWTVVADAALWNFGDRTIMPGIILPNQRAIASTLHAYDRSSYGQPEQNPRGEPGYDSSSTVVWMATLNVWYWVCDPPPVCAIQRQRLPMFAWEIRHHVVPVRQVVSMEVGQ